MDRIPTLPIGGALRPLVATPALEERLIAFAAWLESNAAAGHRVDRGALRAGRAATRLCRDPRLAIETLADEQHVSRRQLERDFDRWMGASPRHLAQAVRVQAVSYRALAHGASLADIAADVGFADQAHMSRVVRQLTGLTPRQFVHDARTSLADGFGLSPAGVSVRAASG